MLKPYYSGHLYSTNAHVDDAAFVPNRMVPAANTKQPYSTEPSWAATFPGNVFYHGPANYKWAALTFDDAPDALFLPIMLDILAHYDVKVTFFALGNCAHQNPDMVKRIVNDGHIIGNHTYDHIDITKISSEQLREQVQKTEDEIYRTVGLKTALFRPPFGFMNEASIRIVLSMGYKMIMWNIDSYDWMGLTGPAITSRVLINSKPGAIILMHNSCAGDVAAGTGTVQSLPFIIETLKSGGYVLTTVATMLNIPAYK
jgi:peptidoglycan/xylan/chitin deacetylase (PgdA/CDA1 family)